MKASIPVNRKRYALVIVASFLVSTHRLPAPIQEVPESPTPAPITKPKAASERPKSRPTGDRSHQFDGTWEGTLSESKAYGTKRTKFVLVIRNGGRSASVEDMVTSTPTTFWSFVPTEYSKSPLIFRWRSISTDLKLDGSNLRVRWEPSQLVEWSPRVIPQATIEEVKKQTAVAQGDRISVYTLRGDQLTREFDSKGGATYTRVK